MKMQGKFWQPFTSPRENSERKTEPASTLILELQGISFCHSNPPNLICFLVADLVNWYDRSMTWFAPRCVGGSPTMSALGPGLRISKYSLTLLVFLPCTGHLLALHRQSWGVEESQLVVLSIVITDANRPRRRKSLCCYNDWIYGIVCLAAFWGSNWQVHSSTLL